jgi:polyisoprenoid-binding protein YceI
METIEVMIATKWHLVHSLSEIGFKVKSLLLSDVRGLFKDYKASIYITGADLSSAEIDLSINPASVDTGNEIRDAHLKSADFLDTKQFRMISFTGNTIERVSATHYAVNGDLTIKGITKRISLDLEFIKQANRSWHGNRLSFYVTCTISRKDFGLTGNALLDSSGVVLSDEVYIDCEIELAKKP